MTGEILSDSGDWVYEAGPVDTEEMPAHDDLPECEVLGRIADWPEEIRDAVETSDQRLARYRRVGPYASRVADFLSEEMQ